MRASLAITPALACAVLAAACGTKGAPECDAFVANAEKLAACPQIPEAQRQEIASALISIKQTTRQIEAVPKDVLEEIRSTCRAQSTRIVNELKTKYPDCSK